MTIAQVKASRHRMMHDPHYSRPRLRARAAKGRPVTIMAKPGQKK